MSILWLANAAEPVVSVPAAPLLGLYTTANTVASAQSLATQLGIATLPAFSVYCDGTSWSSIAGFTVPSGLAGRTLLLGVDLTPNNTGLSAVAANVGTFSTLAAKLPTGTICRVGWEFDIATGPWGAGVNGNTPAQYATASQLAIAAMRQANPSLKFDFSCNTGTSSVAQLQTYYGTSGDSYWDYIGGDHYDNKGGGGGTGPMANSLAFAKQRGKPYSCGEWGLNGADDPAFINAMAQFFLDPIGYTVGYQSYFSANLSIDSDITKFPNSMAAYTAAFG